MFEQVEYTLPIWALPVLINGDNTGTTDEEDDYIDDFIADLPVQGGHYQVPEDIDQEKFLSVYNDVTGNMMDYCVEVKYIYKPAIPQIGLVAINGVIGKIACNQFNPPTDKEGAKSVIELYIGSYWYSYDVNKWADVPDNEKELVYKRLLERTESLNK